MSSSANLYAQGMANAFKGNIKIGTNAIKAGLLKAAYTPNLTTDALWSDISANEASGTNYTAGGVTVTTPNMVVTAANAWATSAATSTAYTVGQVVRPATGNGFLYRCEAAGTSGGTAPSWPTVFGATVADGSVTWTCIGSAIVQFTGDPVAWSNLTCTDFRRVAYYDSVTGYLIAVHDIGSDQDVTSTNVTYTPDATGVFYDFIQ